MLKDLSRSYMESSSPFKAQKIPPPSFSANTNYTAGIVKHTSCTYSHDFSKLNTLRKAAQDTFKSCSLSSR